jgi:hypothetical protein
MGNVKGDKQKIGEITCPPLQGGRFDYKKLKLNSN